MVSWSVGQLVGGQLGVMGLIGRLVSWSVGCDGSVGQLVSWSVVSWSVGAERCDGFDRYERYER